MKKGFIVIFCFLVFVLIIIITTYKNASTYLDFQQAKELGYEIHVIGKLNKDKPMVYEPLKNPNFFSFEMIDKKNYACQVVYYDAKPLDFENADKIVIVGSFKEEKFIAKKILLKCPSKYDNQAI